MTEINLGLFTLVDPPEGLEEVVRATLGAIEYPLERIKPYLTKRGVESIPIRTPMIDGIPNTVTGLWNPGDNTIYLGTQFTGWMDDVPFVLTHEIGHLVDAAVLTDAQRAPLIALMHNEPDPFDVRPPYGHDSAEMAHEEDWWNGAAKNYSARIYECFADLFVASFAPRVWDGTVTAAASAHYPRFIHFTDDFAKVREIVLTADPTKPKPAPAPKPAPPEVPVHLTRGKHIDRALRDISSALHENAAWRRNHRGSKVAWAKVVIANHHLRAAKKSLLRIKPHRG